MHSTTPLLLLLATATALTAADWPNYRGPTHDGISAEKGWQAQWPDDGPAILWKAEVGTGFASFSVADGRVYTTGNQEDDDSVFCFDAVSGRQVWRHTYPADLDPKYYEGGTSATPTVAGGKIYQLSRWGDAMCLDAASGKVAWQKNLQKEAGVRIPDWGYAGSPLVQGKHVLFNMGEAGICVEAATGKIVWKSADKKAGYSTPLPVQRNGKNLILLGNASNYLAVDATTGSQVWSFPWATAYGVNAADPVLSSNLVFISSGYEKGAALLKWSGDSVSAAWQNKEMRNQFNSCVLHKGHLYGIDGNHDKASLKCLELESGKTKWSEKSVGAGSLMMADETLIVLGAKGELMTVPAAPDRFAAISRAQVLKGKCWTAPVLANGLIYCRNAAGSVVCLDVRKK